MDVRDILGKLKSKSKSDEELIAKAFRFSQEKHKDELRYSGDPYFVHPFNVGATLAEMQVDANTVAAGLLHDVCENAPEQERDAREKELQREFGKDIAFLVQGVTKLGKLKYSGEERYLENMRRMFLAMAQDVRVVLIRLADRLHNMQTLAHVPEHKQKRIADETLEVYAPLADRLGMGKLKGILQDLAFPFSFPKEYAALGELVKDRLAKKEVYLAKVKYKIGEEMKHAGISVVAADARVKHFYSLYKKLKRHNDNFDEIYDLVALRIIVNTMEDCYGALGIIHKLWKPLPGRIKDYIALPKPNGYQSIHTTVFCMDGEITEFQIRTVQMHEAAENGIAAHWAYTMQGKPDAGGVVSKNLKWIAQIRDWQKESAGSKEFLESLKIDVFKNRIFVFTPKGDVIDLPEGATPVDFAYHVHSDVGNQCNGAKVNGKMVSLDSTLKNGDWCEILTQKNKKPSPSWLDFVKTNYAKSRIRNFGK
ncbi:bifunctional (p)ppGpp synthetase/guanosine-3',5'-bis(diphosphate) 3'-pyrophosphohydrolase [Candidatus Azambacteria bacterium]|nr:bifunctional (p)ppGpp synthetase/guanosine-3',5'-bis(diphosphate) 3'-pyrophosphohydrolase [Candidatus Azambacteria bacterium]